LKGNFYLLGELESTLFNPQTLTQHFMRLKIGWSAMKRYLVRTTEPARSEATSDATGTDVLINARGQKKEKTPLTNVDFKSNNASTGSWSCWSLKKTFTFTKAQSKRTT